MKKQTGKEKAVKAVDKIQEISKKVSTAVVVQSLQKKAAPTFNRLEKITSITSIEEYDKAAEQVKFLKILNSEADKQEKEITDPLNKALKATRALFKPFKSKVASIETDIKLKMSMFLEAQKKKAVKLEEDFEKGKIKNISTFVKKSNSLHVASSSSQVRNVWTLEIEDEKKIPREYLVPDEAAIKEALKNGTKVPGCKWYQKESIAI